MKKLLSVLFLAFAAVVFSLFLVQPARAEKITSFVSETVVDSQGSATITEVIDYDFGDLDKHGIERYIPLSTKTEGGYYNLDFSLISATLDGQSVDFTDQPDLLNSSIRIIRIGDPNNTISGTHRFAIVYSLAQVVIQDPEGDYINQNIVGTDWPVDIESVKSTVTLPLGIMPTQLRCYTGENGESSSNCKISYIGNVVTISTDSVLPKYNGLAANILMPKASFGSYLSVSEKPIADRSLTGFIKSPYLIFLSVLFSILVIIVGIVIRVISNIRRSSARKNETVIAQYDPPQQLLPAEMGLLLDDEITTTEISSTIIDLAVRGYLKIKIQDKDFVIVILSSDTSKLVDFEKKILGMLLVNVEEVEGSKIVNLNKLQKPATKDTVDMAKDDIISRLVAKGYYGKGKNSALKGRQSIFGGIIGFLVVISFFGSFLAIIAPFLAIYIAYLISQTSKMTKLGYNVWAEVSGFKLFLKVTEEDRLKFTDAPSRSPEQFNKFLPFAVALGVEKEWAKQFKGIDVSQSCGWYIPGVGFDSLILASFISSSLNSSISTSFLGTSSSSGGFSSGGFSGGGSFGGGGGGSW